MKVKENSVIELTCSDIENVFWLEIPEMFMSMKEVGFKWVILWGTKGDHLEN